MKKKLLLLAVAMGVIALGIGSTISYFNSKDTADNVFTVGDVKISLTEPSWDPDADHVIAPNAMFEKDPQVTNIGKTPAYVRMNIEITEYAAIEKIFESSDFVEGYDADIWEHAGEPAIEDGKYKMKFTYYKILNPGDTTEPIFTSVVFPAEIDPAVLEQMSDKFEINITADAIQAEGFANAEEAFEAFDNN